MKLFVGIPFSLLVLLYSSLPCVRVSAQSVTVNGTPTVINGNVIIRNISGQMQAKLRSSFYSSLSSGQTGGGGWTLVSFVADQPTDFSQGGNCYAGPEGAEGMGAAVYNQTEDIGIVYDTSSDDPLHDLAWEVGLGYPPPFGHSSEDIRHIHAYPGPQWNITSDVDAFASGSAFASVNSNGFTLWVFGDAKAVAFPGTNNNFDAWAQSSITLDGTFLPSSPSSLGTFVGIGGPVANPDSTVLNSWPPSRALIAANRLNGYSYSGAPSGDSMQMGFTFPTITGLHFATTDTNLFIGITNFPPHLTNLFLISVDGTNIGSFAAGSDCFFTNDFSGGVSSFDISWIGMPADTNGYLARLSLPLTFTGPSADFNVSFLQPPGPLIGFQPSSISVAQGATTSLAVIAISGEAINYQWQLYGTNLNNANSAVLNLTNAQPSVAGDYRVILNDSSGTETSSVAHVTVATGSTISPMIRPMILGPSSNAFLLQAQLETNKVYRLQFSTDLLAWSDLTNFVSISTNFNLVAPMDSSSRFFRIVSP
jgi:hypothetical protein